MKTYSVSSIIELSVISMFLLLSGCATVGQNYVRPTAEVPAKWHASHKESISTEKVNPEALAKWWSTLNDETLSSLIERGIAGNPNLQQAEARIREARARRAVSKANLFPTFNGTGSVNRSSTDNGSGNNQSSTLYSAEFDAIWEMDIFGRTRRSLESSEATLQADHEDLRDVLVSLQAEVALNYVETRTYQARISVAEENLKIQEETYQITQWRYQSGLGDELAVHQALYNLESTRAQIPALRIGLEESLNRIAILLGKQPGQIHEELKVQKPIPVVPQKITIGIPADIVRQRPDIRRAERELAAQAAKVGVAMADLYPKFSISGLLRASSDALFASGTRSSDIGSKINIPIFNGGSLRQNVKIQQAIQDQYLIKYKTVILNALEEVENTLTSFSEEQNARDNLQMCVHVAQKAADLAKNKYQSGLADFGDVLDAQRSLLLFEEQLVQSNGTLVMDMIRLYKAIGGGWTSQTEDAGN